MLSYEDGLRSYPIQPIGVAQNDGKWPEPKYRFSIIACVRWETRYIVEWLSYHRSIGVDHVYLYCNDDDPTELYRVILPFMTEKEPFITFNHYSFQGLQFQMYFHGLRTYSHETQWLMFLDADEFLCIRNLNSIPVFMERFGTSVDAVYFNWCSFGHNGHMTRPNGDVLLNYTRRERTVTPFTKVFIKSKSVPYESFFRWDTAPVMHDYVCLDRTLSVRNVLNDDMIWYYDKFPERAWPYLLEADRSARILDVAFIAHFNIKSDEDFLLRVKRGLKGDYGAEKMWAEKDEAERLRHHESTNAVTDGYFYDYWKAYLDRGRAEAVFPRARWPLISEGRTADQISTAHDRSAGQDASLVLSGRLTGKPQNHTELEDNPWWSVDLHRCYRVHEVRLFNRLDGVLERMTHFRLESSQDGRLWTIEHVKADDVVYGGADGTPYIWISEQGFEARWLRITVPGSERYLQLDQVQFYGVSIAEI